MMHVPQLSFVYRPLKKASFTDFELRRAWSLEELPQFGKKMKISSWDLCNHFSIDVLNQEECLLAWNIINCLLADV